MIREQLRPMFLMFVVLTLITGVVYPLFVTGIGQILFHEEANGSLISKNGKLVGSALIGQSFDDAKYFWSRPSATSPAYNAASSSGSNYGPMNSDFLKAVKDRVENLKKADPSNTAAIPVDLVTASGSGLDPQISLAAAYYQLPRVARVRQMPEAKIKKMIELNTEERFMGLLGEPAVNVLKLNLLLDDFEKDPSINLDKPKYNFPDMMKWGNWENPRKL